MGLTAVLNDTPEKKRSRDRLLALFGSESFALSPSVWADNGFATIMLHAQAAINDDTELARICSTDQVLVTRSDVEGWAAGFETEIPDLSRQAQIVGLLDAALKRIESAVDHD